MTLDPMVLIGLIMVILGGFLLIRNNKKSADIKSGTRNNDRDFKDDN